MNPERKAASLLRKYSVDSAPIPVIEIAKQEGIEINYHELEDNVSGMLIRKETSAVIAINVKHHENRKRFTIAHELGHYMLHRSEPTVYVDDLLVHFRADRRIANYDPKESEANQFAAALLMPASFIRADLSDAAIDISDDEAVERLAAKYKVSLQAFTIRLDRLDLVKNWG